MPSLACALYPAQCHEIRLVCYQWKVPKGPEGTFSLDTAAGIYKTTP